MDVGLALPHYDFSVPGESPLRWETVVGWAERAEALGFGSVWLSDHLFLDVSRYGAPAGEHGCFDPIVALAALARRTSRVRLGTLTLCGPLRPATVLAKALATLDVIAGGRLTVGLGAGWYEAELEAAGLRLEPPGVRLAHLAETVQVVRGMFGGGPFTFDGSHERADKARSQPRPTQRPAPPIWVGGKGDKLIELAGRHADGWNTAWIWTPEDWVARAALLDAACEKAGRDPSTVTRSVGLYALAGEDEADLVRRFRRLQDLTPGVLDGVELSEWRKGRLVGTVEQVGEQVRTWESLGVSSLVLTAGAMPFALADADDVALLADACNL
jgi:probable F420-dependent oxidoreductase